MTLLDAPERNVGQAAWNTAKNPSSSICLEGSSTRIHRTVHARVSKVTRVANQNGEKM